MDPLRSSRSPAAATACGHTRWRRLAGWPVSQAEQQRCRVPLGGITDAGENPRLLTGRRARAYMDYVRMRSNRFLHHVSR